MEIGTTQLWLLSRLRDRADHAAWSEFEQRYRELLVRFCIRRGLQHADAEDVVQMVFAGLARTLPNFVYDRKRGRFRDYLLRIVRNAISEWACRPERRFASAALRSSSDADPRDSEERERDLWEEEWVAHHYRRALATVRQTFDARSVEVFDAFLAGGSVPDVAARFGMNEDAVRKVRQRVRERMETLIAEQVREEDSG